MARSARVQSTEAIKQFRAKLIKFAENAKAALGDTDAELLRTGTWLRQDRQSFWKAEYRKRAEEFQRTKSALSQKKLYKSATGDRQSTVEEEKAHARAKRRLEEAQEKVDAVKSWIRKLEDERFLYKAQSQRMARAADLEIPRAVAMLDRVLDSLDSYFHETAPSPVTGMSDAFETMARGLDPRQRAEAERVDAERRAECARLRTLALAPAGRDAVPPVDEAPRWPIERSVSARQIKALAALEYERRPVDRDDVVIVAREAASAQRVFLVRTRTSSPGDSGWYVGPVGVKPSSEDCIALTIDDLLSVRKDWSSIFAMPYGYLVVENDDGVEYLCNETDEPVPLVVEDDGPAANEGGKDESK